RRYCKEQQNSEKDSVDHAFAPVVHCVSSAEIKEALLPERKAEHCNCWLGRTVLETSVPNALTSQKILTTAQRERAGKKYNARMGITGWGGRWQAAAK